MTIHVINPNSSVHVTDGIDRAIEPMRAACPVPITTHTLTEGPPAIETDAQVAGVVAPLRALCGTLEAGASAFVIACYSDPGLDALRDQLARPVIGIGEASILTAMTMGERFGIISILSASIARHRRMINGMGVAGRLADDQALEFGVLELADEARTSERLRSVGTKLRDAAEADVLILGCAGMASYRTALENDLGVPVIDPCQAAVAMAIGRVALATTNGIES